jgi:hypothetical protein
MLGNSNDYDELRLEVSMNSRGCRCTFAPSSRSGTCCLNCYRTLDSGEWKLKFWIISSFSSNIFNSGEQTLLLRALKLVIGKGDAAIPLDLSLEI